MRKFIYNRILMLAIAVGLIASLVIAGQRHAVEISNSQVDVAMDFDSLINLAEREGLDFDELLQQVKDAGITSLAIYDTTFEKLTRQGKVIAVYGSDLVSGYYSGMLTNAFWRLAVEEGEIDPSRVYIVGVDPQNYKEAKADLILRVGEERIRQFEVGEYEVIEVKAQFGAFMKMPLGIPSDEMEIAKDAGFMILARPTNFLKCTPEQVRSVFDRLNGYPISEIVFDGPEVLGASDSVDVTISEMKHRELTFGLIEHTSQLQFYPQTGMEQLSQGLGYNNVARLYAIPKDEQPKLLIDVAVNRWATTDHERNIRINLMRIYDRNAPDLTLLETNLQYIKETVDRLKADGYTLGKASTFENYYPSVLLRALVIIGVVAAGILYLSLISRWLNSKPKLQLVLFGVISILAVIPILIGAGGKIRLLAAFFGANLFPTLAIIWQLDRLKLLQLRERLKISRDGVGYSLAQIILLSVTALLITSAASMIGAAYLSGALSDVKYFLEIEIFRGIKLTFILPLILVAIAFLQRFNIVDEVRKNVPAGQQFCEILNMNITVKAMLVAAVVFVAFVVLIARSGHTSGMPVSGLEIKIRAMLEQFFYARPRTKEIFLGHPAFVLAMAAFLKKFPKMICFMLVIIATIGQSSMVETFAHMRTPIFMSFMRGVDGVLPGALFGAILILVLHFAAKLYKGVLLKSQ